MEPPPIPAMDADHPDLYIPEPVKLFLPYFQRTVTDKVTFISDSVFISGSQQIAAEVSQQAN